MLRPLLNLAALTMIGGAMIAPAAVETAPLRQIVDDVVLDAVQTPDGVTACFNTLRGTKVAGGHGIVITATSEPTLWEESLPKTVNTEGDYFELPLRVDLKRRAGTDGNFKLHFELGVCQDDMCLPVEIAIDAVALGRSSGITCGS